MLADFFVPPGCQPSRVTGGGGSDRAARAARAARWTPEALGRIVAALAERGREALAGVGEAALLAAWSETVEAFRNPGSPERQALDPALARLCRLSPEGLAAGMEAVLAGVSGVREGPAAALFARAREIPRKEEAPALAVLAANLPALAVQPLLPALALGRPIFLKSPSAEPLFAPAFLAALVRREPRLADALAAATWPGGALELEAPVLAGVGTVLAYGGREALDDLARRAPGRVVGYGPKTSLGVISGDADPADFAAMAPGLARDVALFDQRGCLSIAAVYVEGNLEDAGEVGARLAESLADLARLWPPGPPSPGELSAVQQLRLEAEMRGLPRFLPGPSLAAGTVLVDSDPAFRPSPGLRTVRVHPLADLRALPGILSRFSRLRGRLQGAALAGEGAWRLAGPLRELGISRTAAPGDLQSPDASWQNGGIDPLAALA